MKKLSILFLCLTAFLACQKNGIDGYLAPADGDEFVVACSTMENAEQTVKSMYSPDLVEKVSDLNIFVYDAEGNLVNDPSKLNFKGANFKTYFPDDNGTKATFRASDVFANMDATYNIFLCSNVGELNVDDFLTEADARNFRYTYNSYSDFTGKGFPRARIYENFVPNESTERCLLVDRLVTKYNITVNNDMDGMNFELTSMSVKQLAKTIQFFSEPDNEYNGSGALSESDIFLGELDGDYFTTDEISDGSGVVYALENYQGQVFTSNVTSKERKYENLLRQTEDGGKITFLEFHGKVTKGTEKVWTDATFRYYFGSTNNGEAKYAFVPRNYNINLRINLSDAEIMEESPDWRVDQGDYISLEWHDAETTINDSNVHTAKLTVNGWSGDVTLNTDNSNLLFGTSNNISLLSNKETVVNLQNGVAKTIYYVYTGSRQGTVEIVAKGPSGLESALEINVSSQIKELLFPYDKIGVKASSTGSFNLTRFNVYPKLNGNLDQNRAFKVSFVNDSDKSKFTLRYKKKENTSWNLNNYISGTSITGPYDFEVSAVQNNIILSDYGKSHPVKLIDSSDGKEYDRMDIEVYPYVTKIEMYICEVGANYVFVRLKLSYSDGSVEYDEDGLAKAGDIIECDSEDTSVLESTNIKDGHNTCLFRIKKTNATGKMFFRVDNVELRYDIYIISEA